jgi:hypothetical protein
LILILEGIRVPGREGEGSRAIAHLRGGRDWFFDFKAEVQGLGLEEIQRFSPENLSGATGEIKGTFALAASANGEIRSSADLKIEEPGGRLPAHFFDFLTPYLAGLAAREKIEKIRALEGFVGYRDASFKMDLVESDKMKVFLHLVVPDYNLDLNLNLEVRLDEKNAFIQLARLAGLMRIQTSR